MLSNSLRTETRVTKTEMYKGEVLRNMRMRGLYNSKIHDNFKILHIVRNVWFQICRHQLSWQSISMGAGIFQEGLERYEVPDPIGMFLLLIEHLYFVISDKVCNKSTNKNITSNIAIIIYN